MRKQRVFLLVFVILALAISIGVYFGARADMKRQRLRDLHERALRSDPFHTLPRRSTPGEPPPSTPPAGSSHENIQRTLKTIEEVQRINRLNAEMKQRQESAPKGPQTPPNDQKKP